MTTAYPGYQPRQRPVRSARSRSDDAPEAMQRALDHGAAELAHPFVGVTTDGVAVPNLYPARATGVSTRPIVDAAQTFLSSLSAEQRDTALFPIATDEWRRWHNTHPNFMRHGLVLEDLDDTQREAALALLRASLSAAGFDTARGIMQLNHTVGELTDSWDEYDEWLYWISIMGTPSADQPWGWQFDGHHLNVQCFILGDQVVMTPTFMGSEPVVADAGKYAGIRVFEAEERTGLAMAQSLSAEQLAAATIDPASLFGGLLPNPISPFGDRLQASSGNDNLQLPYAGIRADALSAGQQELLGEVIGTYVNRLPAGHADEWSRAIQAKLPDTYLAWIGDVDADSVFYYRVHSPVLLIEFDHVRGIAFDNDQPSRQHIRTIVRTPNGNDYGKDLLRQHYAEVDHR